MAFFYYLRTIIERKKFEIVTNSGFCMPHLGIYDFMNVCIIKQHFYEEKKMLSLWARFVVVLLIVPLNLNERSSLLTYISRIAIAKRNLCSSYHDWLDVCVCVLFNDSEF